MACPQKENGYTPIANEIFEAFYLHKFTEYQRVIMMFIWRKTYGWNKKNDRISNSQFVKGTGIPKGKVSETIKGLVSLKIVTRTGNKLGINKNWEDWIVTCRGNTCYLHSEQKVTCTGTTKEKKETKQKKLPAIAGLEAKKKKMKPYQEPSIDIETGELIKEKDNGGKVMKELIAWAENRRGGKFLNFAKQMKALSTMKSGGYCPSEIKERWQEMEKDDFWKTNGMDFMSVVGSFSKKPIKH